MRLVLDTNVWISATIFNGSLAEKLLLGLDRKKAVIFCSKGILAEYERIVVREFIGKKKHSILKERLPILLAKLRSVATVIEPSAKVRVSRDPGDDAILECAVASASDYIVSYDSDLLDLKTYAKIAIVHPKEMLHILSRQEKE